MKIAIAGGGPGGLYLAALMKQLDPTHEVTVWERNAPDDTFGFGVVFSDETLGGIESADDVVYRQMESRFARWTDIDIAFGGQSYTVGGQGFAAMGRKDLLRILQERVAELGVTVHFCTAAPDVDELRGAYDLVVACDGLGSAIRTKHADVFRPSLDVRHNKYIWLGTDLVFEAFEFFVKQTEWGTMQIHGYPYSDSGSTFIVEMHDDVWRRAGFDATADQTFAPGISDDYAVGRLAEIFAEELAGHQVLTNNSKWLNFTTVRNERWYDGNVVLLGDAAHTAHFSIGSGTKLAMEDALALAACLHENADVESALAAYETERKPVVESTSAPRRPRSSGSRTSVSTPGSGPSSSASTCSRAHDGSRSPTSRSETTTSPACSRRSSPPTLGWPSERPQCSSRPGSASCRCTTGWSCRPWTCTPPPTGSPTTSTSPTSARRHSVGPGW